MPLPTTLAGRSQSAYYLAYDSFTRADAGSLGNTEPVGPLGGAVVRAWQTGAGSTWAIVSGEVVDTPTLGSELVSNPEFTVNTVGWNGGAGVTLTRRDYTAAPDIDPTGGTDDFGCEIATIGAGGKLMYQNIAMVNGNWYRHQCRGYAPSANTDVNAATLYSGYMSTTGTPHVTAEDVWETLMLTGRSTSTLQILVTVSSTAGDMIHTDAFSAKQLTLNTLFASVEMGVASVDLQAEIDTLVDNTEAGLVLNLDSVATPANFVIGYHDGTNAKLEKCVAGTRQGPQFGCSRTAQATASTTTVCRWG